MDDKMLADKMLASVVVFNVDTVNIVSTPGITFDEANVAGTVSAALGDQ